MNSISSEVNTITKKPCLDDFKLLSVIGRGAYGRVCLVRRKKDDLVFALKIIKKKNIEKQRQIDQIFIEKQILVSISHPFIVKLISSFQSEEKLFFVLEYCPGGELFNLLQK